MNTSETMKAWTKQQRKAKVIAKRNNKRGKGKPDMRAFKHA